MERLAAQACRHPPGSLDRSQSLNELVRTIVGSGKLWRDRGPDYADALQQTWLYFCQNLCEAVTAKTPYNRDRGRVVTWLNAYLKRRLQDAREVRNRDKKTRSHSQVLDNGDVVNVIDIHPAPPDIPPILQRVQHWAQTDPTGELVATHVRDRPDITCQLLILRRLPPETEWKLLATELDCPWTTLANFYRRQCVPMLRSFGESEGYL